MSDERRSLRRSLCREKPLGLRARSRAGLKTAEPPRPIQLDQYAWIARHGAQKLRDYTGVVVESRGGGKKEMMGAEDGGEQRAMEVAIAAMVVIIIIITRRGRQQWCQAVAVSS